MFRRLFWLVAGIAIGTWGTTKVNRAARKLTPEGIAETAVGRAADLGGQVRRFAQDVRTGMAEREAELKKTPGRTGRDYHRGFPAAPDQALPGQRSGNAYNRKDDH
ncbi:DUF6167 family protein [Wenjunlia tyrosinilytica]|uniref:Secreted protein n=1 Tax=Wenjunlia tyrosinilytica TaxID=1544741 RepID=A0A918DUE0_9ACTN|nr:DUF6167 family protein [Wenjunlia tyrosinilytica]GGO82364.1 hypothetical protein GCM10012280_08790 [Wenjunlia tyrosinilytica]